MTPNPTSADDIDVHTLIDSYGPDLVRLVFAAFIGGLIGIEREVKGKPAGMRTNILICLGSCLVMILSQRVADAGSKTADPGRIAAQVVTGIGFLGAGTIIRSRVSVTGLTSAATIWFVAALGLVVGSGDFVLALAATSLIIITLTALGRLERYLEVSNQLHILRLRVSSSDRSIARIHQILIENRVATDNVEFKSDDDEVRVYLEYAATQKKHQRVLVAIGQMDGVELLLDY